MTSYLVLLKKQDEIFFVILIVMLLMISVALIKKTYRLASLEYFLASFIIGFFGIFQKYEFKTSFKRLKARIVICFLGGIALLIAGTVVTIVFSMKIGFSIISFSCGLIFAELLQIDEIV